MEDFRSLYFHLFAKVAAVIEEYEGNAKYAKVIEKLIAIEQEVEEMYMDMSSPDDEVTDDEDFES
ncbi:MAG: hypothetical protein IJ367_03315 [Clostridia bacterium]|nr:hypothetical protein [Clostridia bacterium]